MATNTRPIKPSDDPNLVIERFQSGDAVDPNYGGTGLTNTELAGNVGKVLAVNATADGYTLTAAGGGGGGGGDSLGSGFTSGGGSGTIPDGTVATADGTFEVAYNTNTNGSQFSLKNNIVLTNGQADDFVGLMSPDESVVSGVGRWIADEGELSYMSFAAFSDRVSEFIQSPYLFQIRASTSDYSQSGLINLLPTAATISVGGKSVTMDDAAALSYGADYSATIATNDRSIPDVGTVNLLKQTPASYDNASAPNNCIFYSTTNSKLAYKDPGGTVNNLY